LTTSDETRHIFVVRVWREAGGEQAGQWRGSVEQPATGQRFYFTALEELADFIALRLPGSGMVWRRGTGAGQREIKDPGKSA
jgi:hypothetical protein